MNNLSVNHPCAAIINSLGPNHRGQNSLFLQSPYLSDCGCGIAFEISTLVGNNCTYCGKKITQIFKDPITSPIYEMFNRITTESNTLPHTDSLGSINEPLSETSTSSQNVNPKKRKSPETEKEMSEDIQLSSALIMSDRFLNGLNQACELYLYPNCPATNLKFIKKFSHLASDTELTQKEFNRSIDKVVELKRKYDPKVQEIINISCPSEIMPSNIPDTNSSYIKQNLVPSLPKVIPECIRNNLTGVKVIKIKHKKGLAAQKKIIAIEKNVLKVFLYELPSTLKNRTKLNVAILKHEKKLLGKRKNPQSLDDLKELLLYIKDPTIILGGKYLIEELIKIENLFPEDPDYILYVIRFLTHYTLTNKQFSIPILDWINQTNERYRENPFFLNLLEKLQINYDANSDKYFYVNIDK